MAEQMPLAFRVVALQGAAVVLVALGCAVMGSEGRTALLGGLCGVAPNLWMALRVTRGLKDGRELASAVGLFVAQIMKLVFMTLLLGLAFWWGRPIDGPAFFAGFIVALAAHHAALVMTSTDG
ncbi:MAG: ATP synthase subunit I [Pseudomonadales bacterium]|jgi:F0F1-type ATP synthase assembly protein I|nr:ATP synthase subunit I [Pseudomonadales bacterium]